MSTNLVRESEIEAYLVKRVREAGGISYKFVSPGVVGVPDRIVIWNGIVAFVEVKAPGGRVTALQEWHLRRLLDHGVIAGTCSSKYSVDRLIEQLTA